MADDIPRRVRHNLHTPAERAITAAMLAVEALPADLRLTAAVVTLGKARDHVSDYVDSRLSPPDPRDAGIAMLRAAFNLMRQASHQSHTGHWDRTGGSGSGCPECIRASALRAEADAIVAALKDPTP